MSDEETPIRTRPTVNDEETPPEARSPVTEASRPGWGDRLVKNSKWEACTAAQLGVCGGAVGACGELGVCDGAVGTCGELGLGGSSVGACGELGVCGDGVGACREEMTDVGCGCVTEEDLSARWGTLDNDVFTIKKHSWSAWRREN